MSTAVLDRPITAPAVTPEGPAARPRLSEAIREGATHHPQGTGHMYNPRTQATCAVGALMVGLLGPRAFHREMWQGTSPVVIHKHTGLWVDYPLPVLRREPVLQPWYRKTGEKDCSLGQALVYLNDDAGWSREAIADWLESIGY